MSASAHYDRKLVFIHWLSAFLIIFMLLFGMLVLKRLPNDESKLISLAVHMVIGLTIRVITLLRIFVRNTTPKPIPATTGNRVLDMIGTAVLELPCRRGCSRASLKGWGRCRRISISTRRALDTVTLPWLF